MRIHLGVITAVLIVFSTPAGAQWLKYKTPGIPRTTDGKPDLNAPAPRTADGKPDLSGLWRENPGGYAADIASDLKPGEVLPWAEELYKKREAEFSKDFPGYRCMPLPGFFYSFGLFKIMQTPGLTAILAEASSTYRQIFTDGRSFPEDISPTWMGYSVGHWDGDTFVVESAGFNDRTWLDFNGHPHSEALRVTERFFRKDFGHMQHQITLDDPKVFTKPVTISLNTELAPDTEMLETVCNENEQDVKHFVVTDADLKRHEIVAKLPHEVLVKYAGTYEPELAGPGGLRRPWEIILDGDQLFLKTAAAASKFPLEAKSETTFSAFGGSIVFSADDKGAVTHLVLRIVEGDFKFIKK
jgi:hypothetical protein